MVKFCAVDGCTSSGHPFIFYGFPKVKTVNREHRKLAEARRSAWYKALNRNDITEDDLDTRLVCNRHFVSGKPALLFETENPDWAPSMNIPTRSLSFLDFLDFSPKKQYSPIRKPIHQNSEGSSSPLQTSFKSPEKLKKPYSPIRKPIHQNSEGSSSPLQKSFKSPEKLKKPNTPIKRQFHSDAEDSSTPINPKITKSPLKLKNLCIQLPRIDPELYTQSSRASVHNELTNGVVNRTPVQNSTSNTKPAVRLIDAQTQTDLSGEYMDKLQRSANQFIQLKKIMGKFKGADISMLTQVRVKLERCC